MIRIRDCHGSQNYYEIFRTFRNYSVNPADVRDAMRVRFGECGHPDHRTHLMFQPVLGGDGAIIPRTRAIYREWQALVYKRFGRTWNAMKQRKLDRMRAEIVAMEREKAAFDARRAFYGPIVRSENDRIKKARRKTS